MLEAMFKLLKLEVQVAVAIMTLASGVILWLLRPLVRRMWSALERNPQPPQKQQARSVATVASVSPEPPAATSPVSSVVIIREPGPATMTRPSRTAAQSVLGEPDHALYIATSSTVVLAHPRSDDLLDMVDRMGLVALHRDGAPFIDVAPDRSLPGGPELTLLPFPDDLFLPEVDPHPIPKGDGALWIRCIGGFTVVNSM